MGNRADQGLFAPEAVRPARRLLRRRASEVGFEIKTGPDSRIYNTFDAHRLLHWAEPTGKQAALKRALFTAYFTEGLNPSDHDVLVAKAQEVGLDPSQAQAVLTSGRYTEEVRAAERLWHERGINSVPAVVIDDQYLISGGQPAAAFEKALRSIAADT